MKNKKRLPVFYDSSNKMDDFTQHFVDCLCSEANKNSDYIEDKEFEYLNEILEKMLKATYKEETLKDKLWHVLKSIASFF